MDRKIGRDARDGQFITVEEAQRRPSTTIVETVKPTKPPAKPPTKPSFPVVTKPVKANKKK